MWLCTERAQPGSLASERDHVKFSEAATSGFPFHLGFFLLPVLRIESELGRQRRHHLLSILCVPGVDQLLRLLHACPPLGVPLQGRLWFQGPGCSRSSAYFTRSWEMRVLLVSGPSVE